jgi:pilin isopeptide linkage protein
MKHRHHLCKRIFALLCTLAVIVSVIQISAPISIFAEGEGTGSEVTEVQTGEDQSSGTEQTAEEQTVSLSEEAAAFISAAGALDHDAVLNARTAVYTADANYQNSPDDSSLLDSRTEAETAFAAQSDAILEALAQYEALSETDQADADVQNAYTALTTLQTDLATLEKTAFVNGVNDLGETPDDASISHLNYIYDSLSDVEKADADVMAARTAMEELQNAAVESPAAEEVQDETAEATAEATADTTETSDPESTPDASAESTADSSTESTETPASEEAAAKPQIMLESEEVSTASITGTLKFADDQTKNVLLLPTNTEFFQFQVTAHHSNGTTDVYTTHPSGTYTSNIDFDWNYTLGGIPYVEGDTYTVKAVPESSISSFIFTSTETAAATPIDNNGIMSANAGTVTLSIDKVTLSITDTVLADEGSSAKGSYSGNWTYSDSAGHSYSTSLPFRRNADGTVSAVIPSGANVTVKASLSGYTLSTKSKTVSNGAKISNPGGTVSYEYIWIQTESQTFTKTWLDDGSSDHSNTGDLMNLQYSADGGNTWNNATNSALGVSSITDAVIKSNADGSVYSLTYQGLPKYLYDGTALKYRMNESNTPSGYSVAVDEDGNVVNTKEYDLSFTVNWDDADNAEGKRPSVDAFREMLKGAVVNGETETSVTVDTSNIEITVSGNTWTVAVHGLSAFNGTKDNPNTYYVEKDLIGVATGDENVTYGLNINNAEGVHENSEDAWNGADITYTIARKKSFTVGINWEDVYEEYRPEAVYSLYSYTGDTVQNLQLIKTGTVSRDSDMILSFEDYDAYDANGNALHYIVKETFKGNSADYTIEYPNGQDYAAEDEAITNRGTKVTTRIRVTKTWNAKGTTLKITGYEVKIGLKRKTDGSDWEIVKDDNGEPVYITIDGFSDYNDLTKRGYFDDMALADEEGNFYTYMPYEFAPDNATNLTGYEDGTLDAGDSFMVDGDSYTVSSVSTDSCAEAQRYLSVSLLNRLDGRIRFSLEKTWAVEPTETSIEYAIHRVDAYGNDVIIDSNGNPSTNANTVTGTYTPENAASKEWGVFEPDLVLPLYNENDLSRYTYYVEEIGSSYERRLDYTIEEDTTDQADLIEKVQLYNNNSTGGGSGEKYNVDLTKKWVDGGDTSTRQPITVKLFRVDQQGNVDRPAEWDEQNIGVFVISAATGWQVSDYTVFSPDQVKKYFSEYTDSEGITHTFDDETFANNVTYREVMVGNDEVDAGENNSYDHVVTTATSGSAAQNIEYEIQYNDTEIINIKQSHVVYEIDKEWYDGHYLEGRPDVTFNIKQDGKEYAQVNVSVDDNGNASAVFTINGVDVTNDEENTFELGSGEEGEAALNDYILTFGSLPLYNTETGSKYTYTCEEICEDSSYTSDPDPILDAGKNNTKISTVGENGENMKITRTFRNRRVEEYSPVTFTKEWKDNSDLLGYRPQLSLTLYAKVTSEAHKDELIPLQLDAYAVVNGNTVTYEFAQELPNYVTTDLIALSNGELTEEDDLGAEVTYYASETMSGDYADQYKMTYELADDGSVETYGSIECISEGSTFINTLSDMMEAEGTVIFSNVPFNMSKDPDVMPKDGSLTFTLYQRVDDGETDDFSTTPEDNGYKKYLVDGEPVTASLVRNDDGTYSFTFYDADGNVLMIPKYDEDGNPYRYTVSQAYSDEDIDFSDIFELTYVSRDLQVTDRYKAARRTITVTKSFNTEGWTEEELANNSYPDVTFQLYRLPEGVTFNASSVKNTYLMDTVTISGEEFANGTTVTRTFDDLYDLAPSGLHFNYYVVETKIYGYKTEVKVNGVTEESQTAVMQGSTENGYENYDQADFTNTYLKDEKINTISASKAWGPTGLDEKLIPSNFRDLLSFTLKIYKEGDLSNPVATLTQGTDFKVNWNASKTGFNDDEDHPTYSTHPTTYGFTLTNMDGGDLDLRKYTSDGKRYRFVLSEVTTGDVWNNELMNFRCTANNPAKWSTETDKDNTDELTIGTITNTYGRSEIYVTKQWDDNFNNNGLRARSITVKLQYKLSTDTEWKYVDSSLLGTANYSVNTSNGNGTLDTNGDGKLIDVTNDGVVDDYSLDKGVTFTLNTGVADQTRTWDNCVHFYNLPKFNADKVAYEYRVVEVAIDGDPLSNPVGTEDSELTAASYKRTTWTTSGNRTTIRNELLKTSASATKIWNDTSDLYDARPDTLTLYLQRKKENGSWEPVKLTNTKNTTYYTVKVDTSQNEWKSGNAENGYTVDRYLPREDNDGNRYYYRLTEITPESTKVGGVNAALDTSGTYITGVKVKGSNGKLSYTGVEDTKNDLAAGTNDTKITNTLDQTMTLQVTKKWNDGSGAGRPDEVTVVVRYKDDTTNDQYIDFVDKNGNIDPVKLKLNSANLWTMTLYDLPLTGKDGSERSYRAYELDQNGNAVLEDGDLTLNNTLYRAEYDVTDTAATDTKKAETDVTITNNKRAKITVTKVWADGSSREVTRPDSLTITCTGDNGENTSSKTISNITSTEDSYSVIFTVDEFTYDEYDAASKKIRYTITESGADGYEESQTAAVEGDADEAAAIMIDGKAVDGDHVTITNTNEISIFDLTMDKTWDDSDNAYGTRPDAVKMDLQYSLDGDVWQSVNYVSINDVADGDFGTAYAGNVGAAYTTSSVEQTLYQTAPDQSLTWKNLPVYANVNGVKTTIQYRVHEEKVTGYNNDQETVSTAVTGADGDQTVDMENSLIKTQISLTKNWKDDQNYNGQRPDKINVDLIQTDGTTSKVLKNLEVTGDVKADTWTYSLTGLPKESSTGSEYAYSLKEVSVPGYSVKQSGSMTDGFIITNTVEPVKVELSLTKSFDHWEEAPEGFTFTLSAADETSPMPTSSTVVITDETADHTASFGEMSYDHVGTYEYTVVETDGDTDGLAYDWNSDENKQNVHQVVVSVTVGEDGKLKADVTYDGADSLTIVNTYHPVEVNLSLVKYFNDWTKTENGFTFTLTGENDAPMPEDATASVSTPDQTALTKQVDDQTYTGGTAAFDSIAYNKAGTYEYTITEVNGSEDGISYDTAEHHVTVTVTKADDASNALSAAVTYDGEDHLEIVNTFTPVDVTLDVTKDFNDWTKADSFTFKLQADDENAPVNETMQAVATEEAPDAVFDTLTFTKAGTYTYTITENNDGMDGVSYDVTEHKAVVTVTKADDATNTLSAYVTYDDGSDSLTIENTYTPVTTQISVSKSFNGWDDSETYGSFFDDAVFTVDLKAVDGAPMPEGTDASGTAQVQFVKDAQEQTFPEITFEKAGVYRYTLQEENGQLDGVDYDSEGGTDPAVHTVTVTVTKADDATNALSAQVSYDDGEEDLTIVNTFTPIDPPVEATKSFNDWSKADGFTFRIKAVGNAPLPSNLSGIATEDQPTVVFKNIVLYQTGVYEYEITEDNDGIANITYDDTVHTVKITVTKADDASNALQYSITYDDQDELVITNVYTEPEHYNPLPLTPDDNSSNGSNTTESSTQTRQKLPLTSDSVNTGVDNQNTAWFIILAAAVCALFVLHHHKAEG